MMPETLASKAATRDATPPAATDVVGAAPTSLQPPEVSTSISEAQLAHLRQEVVEALRHQTLRSDQRSILHGFLKPVSWTYFSNLPEAWRYIHSFLPSPL